MSFVQYDRWQDQTTVGMPEFKTVVPVEEDNEKSRCVTEEEGLSEDVYAFIAVAPVF